MSQHEQDTLQRSETGELISSSKVDGTSVYDRKGEKIGSVDHLMIGKVDGNVRYAVVSFGGFLGIGEDYHPLPWQMLEYDTGRGGYVVDLDKDRLEGAPSYGRDSEPEYDRAYNERVTSHYGVYM